MRGKCQEMKCQFSIINLIQFERQKQERFKRRSNIVELYKKSSLEIPSPSPSESDEDSLNLGPEIAEVESNSIVVK